MRVRAARPDEAEALSALVLRSKAHWGYDAAFLAACRDELRLRPGDVAARRAVVAERDGTVAGVATLDGDPPDGELGLLFVEPRALRTGVGRLLYRHVLAEAGRQGFARVTVRSDPHAAGFYRAMGAEPAAPDAGLPVFTAWPVPPEPAWARAWAAGGPDVRVGNVAAFNGQFCRVPQRPDHYSCMVMFCGPMPAGLVLPERVDDWWLRATAAALGWDDVPALTHVAGGRVVPWGRTSGTPEVMAAIRHYESKRHAHALFTALAPEHPGIVVPARRPVRSRRALARELAGGPLVLKAEYGVGGSGTRVVTPGGRLPRRVAGLLVEDHVAKDDRFPDPTFDAFIDGAGTVHPVGTGLMDVAGTAYRGVTVGRVPGGVATTAETFGVHVGRVLAEDGYRGWYDVDFVTARTGRLAPTEINLRLTGPAVAFHLKATFDRLRGGDHLVRTLDRVPLGARLPPPALRRHVERLTRTCADAGAVLVVTIPTAAFDPVPYLGVALAARTPEALDQATQAVRDANRALGAMFRDLDVSRRGAGRTRTRRARPPRA
ncbi:Acetyltransferase (GNAT) family protein [Actinomadura rubteroloni]|uniref:Acetyltransferase (GNAT) family protein n=1 Tax=Actinomadura rubteroloni TaxID=1926885 RepID=A0A2P4UJE2_9ACTN|nr:GNAT family N-acetyltransferase [Actinomadura rubteroloni]POM25185.1 Acetyltransferase (GNAT) family protein [Actinomadura rubteroloni]